MKSTSVNFCLVFSAFFLFSASGRRYSASGLVLFRKKLMGRAISFIQCSLSFQCHWSWRAFYFYWITGANTFLFNCHHPNILLTAIQMFKPLNRISAFNGCFLSYNLFVYFSFKWIKQLIFSAGVTNLVITSIHVVFASRMSSNFEINKIKLNENDMIT